MKFYKTHYNIILLKNKNYVALKQTLEYFNLYSHISSTFLIAHLWLVILLKCSKLKKHKWKYPQNIGTIFTVKLHFVFKRQVTNLEFLKNLKVSLDYCAKSLEDELNYFELVGYCLCDYNWIKYTCSLRLATVNGRFQ